MLNKIPRLDFVEEELHAPLGRDLILSISSSVMADVSIGGSGCSGWSFWTMVLSSASSSNCFGSSLNVTKSRYLNIFKI